MNEASGRRPTDRPWPFRILAVLALAAVCGALVFLVFGGWARESLLKPLALRLSGDGVLTPGFEARLDGMVRTLGKALLAAALGFGGLAWLWRSAMAGLPAPSPVGAATRFLRPRWPDAAVLLAGAGILSWNMASLLGSGLEYDELFTKVHFVDAPSAWQTASRYLAFNNHVGYSLLARACAGLFGPGEIPLRLPAVAFGILSLPALWVLAARHSGRSGAAVAVLLLALSPAFAHWTATGRGYTGMALFSLVSGIAYLEILGRPSRRAAALLAASTAIGAWLQFFTGFVTLVQGIHLAWRAVESLRSPRSANRLDREAFRCALLALVSGVGLALLLHAPVLHRIAAEILVRTGEPAAGHIAPAVLSSFAGDRGALAAIPLLILAAAGALAGGVESRHARGYLALLVLVPVAAAEALGTASLYPRFFLFALPAILALGAVWVEAGSRRAVRVALSASVAIPLLGAIPLSPSAPGIREACAWIREAEAAGRPVYAVGGDAVLVEAYAGVKVVRIETSEDLHAIESATSPWACVWIPITGTKEAYAPVLERLQAKGRRTDWNGVVLFERR